MINIYNIYNSSSYSSSKNPYSDVEMSAQAPNLQSSSQFPNFYPNCVPSDVEKEIEKHEEEVELKNKSLCLNCLPGLRGKSEQ